MKDILVPTDFSPSANKAVDFAIGIAKQAGCGVCLLHACDVLAPFYLAETGAEKAYNEKLMNAAREELNLMKKSIEEAEKVPVKSLICDRDVIHGILDAAKQVDAGMIVMGTLGASGAREKLFGSVTASVLQRSNLPVLVIPILCEWSVPKKILAAVNDFSLGEENYRPLFDLASLVNATVVLTVFTDSDQAHAVDYLEHGYGIQHQKEKLDRYYPGQSIETAHLDDHHFTEAIDRYIREQSMDMLAMFMHKRKFVERLFHPSMTRKMSYHTEIPLLVLPS